MKYKSYIGDNLFLSYKQHDGNNQKYMMVMGWTILYMDYDSSLIIVVMLFNLNEWLKLLFRINFFLMAVTLIGDVKMMFSCVPVIRNDFVYIYK